jgi:hypothetical protein
MALYGNEMVGFSEACSTMANCVCGTLHSPGRPLFHHCPNPACKRVKVRDECARMIGVIGEKYYSGRLYLQVEERVPFY